MSEAGPFKAKRMRVTVIDCLTGESYTLGVVEGLDIKLHKEGGVVPHYDSEVGKHAIGTRHGTFRLKRWLKTDSNRSSLDRAQHGLLFDMFNNETHFNLSGEISALGGSTIMLSDCVIYDFGPVTGGANDIVSEEAVGQATDWVKDTIY